MSAQAPPADEEEGEDGAAAPRAKPSGIGRVLNGGLPLACGHCKGETKGVGGELNSVDISPQGVSVRWNSLETTIAEEYVKYPTRHRGNQCSCLHSRSL